MKADDLTPRARSHYHEEDYFSLNVRNGIIRSPIGTRMLVIPEELVQGLHVALQEETGGASGVVLYACGRWWGRQFVKRHATEVRQFYQVDLGELPLHFQQQLLRRVWAMYGWGLLDMSFDLRDQGFVEVTVQNAMYSETVGNLGRPSDHLIAGVLASIVTELAGRDVECVETACKSKGDPRCHFLVGIQSRVDVVTAWLKQGRTRAQIVDSIAAGELA
jgi:hypothetical protein